MWPFTPKKKKNKPRQQPSGNNDGGGIADPFIGLTDDSEESDPVRHIFDPDTPAESGDDTGSDCGCDSGGDGGGGDGD